MMQFQLSEDSGEAIEDTYEPEYGYKIPRTEQSLLCREKYAIVLQKTLDNYLYKVFQ